MGTQDRGAAAARIGLDGGCGGSSSKDNHLPWFHQQSLSSVELGLTTTHIAAAKGIGIGICTPALSSLSAGIFLHGQQRQRPLVCRAIASMSAGWKRREDSGSLFVSLAQSQSRPLLLSERERDRGIIRDSIAGGGEAAAAAVSLFSYQVKVLF